MKVEAGKVEDRSGQICARESSRAVAAQDDGKFADEISPVNVADGDSGKIDLTEDEGPRRDTSLEKMSKLKPVFKTNGSVTAGNSSGLNDGAAGLMLCSEHFAKENNITPIAESD